MHADGQTTLPGTSPSVLPSAIPDHELLDLIGRGAYGEVWRARNAIGTLRAVKIVHRRSFLRTEHFEREFKGLLKFEPISRSHDGLVDVLQIGRRDDAGYFFYVMELADDCVAADVRRLTSADLQPSARSASSEDQKLLTLPATYAPKTLRSELQTRGQLPPSECVTLGVKLATALEHLHTNGLVHRDIKPSNIIFVKGEPKLADIGLVSAIDDAHSLVGTVGYIPPEGPGTPQADLYSLGKVLYEIAFGKDRQDFPQLPPDLQSHPDYAALLELNEVILKSCETDPRRRYADATTLRQDLALLLRGQSVKQAHASARRWKVVRQLALLILGLALLATAIPIFRSSKSGHTPNPEAVHLYELGRWHYSQLTPEAHQKALEALSQAAEKDPKFTQPYGELMMLYTWNMLPGITNEHIRLQRVWEIAGRALAINPDSAEGHMAVSWCQFLQRDWRGAEVEIQRAATLNPDLALAHDIYCFYLSMQGRVAEARREGELSARQPPVSQRASSIIAAWPDMAERRFDLAIAKFKQVLELDRNFVWGYSYLGDCYEATSNYAEAIEAYRTSDLLEGKDSDKVNANYNTLRQALKDGGQQAYFRKWIELVHIDRALPENERTLNYAERDLAGFYAQLGEKDLALKLLEDHFDEPQTWHQIKFLWWFDPLHDDPRFKALVERAGLSN